MKNKLTLVLFCLFFFGLDNVHAQKQVRRFSAVSGLDAYSSGNGHGRLYMPYAGISSFKNDWSLGMLIQKRTMEISGARMTYKHHLALNNDRRGSFNEASIGCLQLSTLSFFQYLHNSPLSMSMATLEQTVNPSETINWYDAKLSTLEIGSGFQVGVKLGEHIRWNNYAAATVYYRTQYPAPMYYSRSAFMICYGTGIQVF